MVEADSFLNMIASFDPRAKMITSVRIKAGIWDYNEKIWSLTMEKMKDCDVSITLDHWTSKQKFTYVGMTAHWVNKSFTLHSGPLGMFLHEGQTTGDMVLTQFFKDIARELNKNAKVFSVTSDTTGSMDSFGMLLEARNIHHLFCTDHVLHLT